MICENCKNVIDDNELKCPICGFINLGKSDIKNYRIAVSENKILIHTNDFIMIENDLSTKVFFDNILKIDLIEGKIIIYKRSSNFEVIIDIDRNIPSVKEIIKWVNKEINNEQDSNLLYGVDYKNKQINNVETLPDTKGIIKIRIVGGSYSERSAVYDSIANEIILNVRSDYDYVQKHISLENVKSIKNVIESYGNYSVFAAKYVGLIIGGLMAIYNFIIYPYNDFGWRLTEALVSFVISGLIFAGIAFVIGYFIKRKQEIIRIITIDDYLIDIEPEPIIESYLFKENGVYKTNFSQDESINNDENELKFVPPPEIKKDYFQPFDLEPSSLQNRTSSIDNKYNDLLKLKELLDKDIITQDEFQLEKEKILVK